MPPNDFAPLSTARRARAQIKPWSERTTPIPRTLEEAFGPGARGCPVVTAQAEREAQERAMLRRDGHHLVMPVSIAVLAILALLLAIEPATLIAAVS